MSFFNKIVEMDEYFNSGRSMEPTVSIIDFNRAGSMRKVASEASDWSHSVKPKPGSTYILVLAMGASEFYGPNRNGDAFRESELKKTYKTFESNAHVFRSHVNKDPAKSMGSVVKSFYNDEMHRVELILELEDSKCPDIVDKIRNNETVAVSMGCRIEYDVCTICGNKAPTRKQYCEHLLNELNDIYPDGRIVAADNPNPTFFDISVVYKPADKTGYMLKKVANNGRYRDIGESSAILNDRATSKTAISKYLSKAADIEKIVTGVGFLGSSTGSKDTRPTSAEASPISKEYFSRKWIQSIVPKIAVGSTKIDDHDLQFLSTKELPKVMSSLSDMGLFLTTPEFLDMIFLKLTGKKSPEGLGEKLVSLQGDIFRLLAKHPDVIGDTAEKSGIAEASEPSREIQDKMACYVSMRSLDSSNILKQSFKNNTVKTADMYDTLPRLQWPATDPELVKLAVELVGINKAICVETTERVKHSDISAMSKTAGYVECRNMPWVPVTMAVLDRYAGNNSFIKSSAARPIYTSNLGSAILNLIYN
jgi:hypothetical protein